MNATGASPSVRVSSESRAVRTSDLRLLLFNLVMDADDPVLGFATSWVKAIAHQVRAVHVVTMRAGRLDLPDNVRVYSVGKEKGFSEPRRAVECYRHLFGILRRESIDACFSHMNPAQALLAAPVLRLLGIPLVTWYAHPTLTWKLKLGHFLSTRMVSSLATAYPYRHDKLVVVGQGIDPKLFSPDESVMPDDPPVILCVGRLSPVKDHPTLLRGAHLLRQRRREPFQVVVVGDPAGTRGQEYAADLRQMVVELGLEHTVRLLPAVSREELPPIYRRCTIHVNLTPTGFGDKVAWEALSCGRPSLIANAGFRETLGDLADELLFRHGDAAQLADRLQWLLALAPDERGRMGSYLRDQVTRLHSLDRLAAKLAELCAGLASGHTRN